MIKEKLNSSLYDKIPDNSVISIYGANKTGKAILNELISSRKNVVVKYFIDENIENFENIETITLKEVISRFKHSEFSFVVIATTTSTYLVNNILNIFNIPFIGIDSFIEGYYTKRHELINEENYHKLKAIFKYEDDKNIFDIMFKRRCRIYDDSNVKDYFNSKYGHINAFRVISKQYIEKINKDAVKTVFDIGFNSGFNSIAFERFLPCLEKIYGFEVIYDLCKNKTIESFLNFDKIKIINKAIGEKEDKVKFFIDSDNINASLLSSSSIIPVKNKPQNFKEIEADVTTIDAFCNRNGIMPDLIKMDIEGSELSALKGGIETIKQSRSQLAISIYHTDYDFINIPLYLQANLKNYVFMLGQYAPDICETILYAIPEELE